MKLRLIAVLLLTATAGLCASRISVRKRLHINPLITDAGTFEFDWGGAFPIDGPAAIPTAIRFTPGWGRTEFSATFDARRFDQTTFGMMVVALDTDHFDIGVSPIAAATTRGDRGVKGGGLTIARYDDERNSAGVSAGWVAGTVDVGAGYGRLIRKKFTAHLNGQWEKSAGTRRQISIAEGVEYQITDPFAIDVSAQHGSTGNQVIVGLTFRTPRLHRH